MSTVSKRLITLFVGIILIAVAFILNSGVIRVILAISGLVLLTISNSLERTNKKLFLCLFAIIFFFFLVSLDYLIVGAFKKTPIFSYSIIKTNTSTVYNAIGYRVWVCNDKDKTFKVDNLYKLGYYCSTNDLVTENVNNFLPKVKDNFNKYKDVYMKITGKISNILSDTKFTMQVYNEELNMFESDIILEVNFNYANKELNKHSVLDEVTIVGKIESFDNNIVRMIDSNFLSSSTFETNDTYSFDVNENIYCQYDKELWFQNNNQVYYRSCINSLDITINDDTYDLSFAIKNNIITLQDLKDSATGYLSNNKDEANIYIFNNFKMLVCNNSSSSDVIFGKTTMSFDDGYCKISDNSEVGV